MKKTVNGHFLFRLQYNCPVFPSNIQDRRRSGQRFFDILIFIAEMIFSVSRNSPMGDYQNILLTGEHSEPVGKIRTPAYGPTQKSFPSVQAVFRVAPAPISSRFLCPRPPLLLSAPNQNRHATQAKCLFTFALVPLRADWRKSYSSVDGDVTVELEVNFNFQRHSCKFSFLFPPRRQSPPERACSQVTTARA